MSKLFIINKGIGKFYYKDKECIILHRETGPAIEYGDGTTIWYLNGKCHRKDGPAVEIFNIDRYCFTNSKQYYFNGVHYNNIDNDDYWVSFIKTIMLI